MLMEGNKKTPTKLRVTGGVFAVTMRLLLALGNRAAPGRIQEKTDDNRARGKTCPLVNGALIAALAGKIRGVLDQIMQK